MCIRGRGHSRFANKHFMYMHYTNLLFPLHDNSTSMSVCVCCKLMHESKTVVYCTMHPSAHWQSLFSQRLHFVSFLIKQWSSPCVCVCVRVCVCIDYTGQDILLEIDDSRNKKRVQIVTVKHSTVARQDDITVEYAKFACDTCQRSLRRTYTRHHQTQKCQTTCPRSIA